MPGTAVVLGGGVSGLAAAYRLASSVRPPKRIVLLEASSRLGGWIKTTRHEDGVLFEHGPRTLRPVGESAATVLKLVEELGVTEQVIHVSKDHPSAQNRLVYHKEKLTRLPTDLKALFRTSPPFRRPLAACLLQDLLAPANPQPDESLHQFVARRLGQDVADFAVDPLVRGICAGDCREISVNFLMKFLKDHELKHGSITAGVVSDIIRERFSKKQPLKEVPRSQLLKDSQSWSVWSLEGGLETLTESLASKSAQLGVELFTESPVTGLRFGSGEAVVEIGDSQLEAQQVFSALPAWQLSKLLGHEHADLRQLLAGVQAVDVGLVNMQWPGERITQPAFGFLVPSSSPLPLLGVVFDSCSFPQGDRTVLTCMMGGRWFHELFGDPDSELVEEKLLHTAQKQVQHILGIKDLPERSEVHILRQCIPQYVIGHAARVREVRHLISGILRWPLHLIGASYDGVSVNDCIHHAFSAVDDHLQREK